jgi:Ca-activated chloride channel family protein
MSFLYPEVFYMMLIPLVLLIVLVLTSKNNMEKYFSKDILDKLSVGGKTLDKNTRNGLLFFTLVLFIVALGRPVINQKEQDIKQKLIPIVVALDVSTSMMATDIYPNRISLAIEKLKQIIAMSQNTTIGVLLFAKDSFVLSPVTEDFISLNYIVKNLETNLNFPNGSNILATLDATNYMLEDFNVKNLIILSDGGNSDDYKDEISYAKSKNIAVYTIGIATKKGAVIPNKNGGYLTDKGGNIVTVTLNESIKKLALETNGGYVDFSLDSSDVKAIIERINAQSQKEELSVQKFKTYTELFYYPLALGLFFLFLALSSMPTSIFKKNIAVFILVGLYFTPSKVDADIFNFQTIKNAKQLYEDKKYNEASNEYRKLPTTAQSFYNLGDALYKEKKYQEALDTYKKVITEDKELERKKLHNIGNSYVKLNDLEKAKEFYEKSLKIKKDKETQENLDIVNKELEKQKEQNKDKKENQDNKNQDNKNQENKEDKNKENQKDSQKNQDNKEKKNQEKSQQEKQEQQKKEQQEQEKQQQNKNDKNKESKPSQMANQTQENKNDLKKDEISQMEERKWMEQLEKETTPILLRKANTQKESKSDETKPW